MAFASLLPPGGAVEGEHRIAARLDMHFGQMNAAGKRQRGTINLRPTHDHDFIRPLRARRRQRRFQRSCHHAAFGAISRIACDDDVGAAGQRALRKTLPGPAAHDDRLAHGQRLEPPHVFRNAPRNAARIADHAIVRHGQNERYHRHVSPVPKGSVPASGNNAARWLKIAFMFCSGSLTHNGIVSAKAPFWRFAHKPGKDHS